MDPRVYIEGIPIDNLTMDEAVANVLELIDEGCGGYVVTPNPEILSDALKNDELKGAIESASLSCADGIGVVYASKILKKPLKERVSGFDLTCRLMEPIAQRGNKLFLFGAKEGVAIEAASRLKADYPALDICAVRNGYFSSDEEKDIAREIKDSGANLVLVCLGAPKQELFMKKYRQFLAPAVMMGVGGSLDVLAGNVKRAPEWMIRLHLEWLYRLITEPSRIKRQLVLPKFMWLVMKEAGKKR